MAQDSPGPLQNHLPVADSRAVISVHSRSTTTHLYTRAGGPLDGMLVREGLPF